MKIGDRVRFVGDECIGLVSGQEYTILSIDGDEMDLDNTTGDTCTFDFYNDGFELVKATKSYLMEYKDEYVIELEREMIKPSALILEDYEENLEVKKHLTTVRQKIIAIHKLVPVWERDTRPEMTIEEAEKKFGFRLKEDTSDES